ncbi:hypothetical protein ACR79T_10100 [Sphingobacterium spiritivorum]|uniref:hypothetical protein n=1 Tax=Sphingobacterium spiritivorum TaxID=258 RepID=UPI003DA4A8BD
METIDISADLYKSKSLAQIDEYLNELSFKSKIHIVPPVFVSEGNNMILVLKEKFPNREFNDNEIFNNGLNSPFHYFMKLIDEKLYLNDIDGQRIDLITGVNFGTFVIGRKE